MEIEAATPRAAARPPFWTRLPFTGARANPFQRLATADDDGRPATAVDGRWGRPPPPPPAATGEGDTASVVGTTPEDVASPLSRASTEA